MGAICGLALGLGLLLSFQWWSTRSEVALIVAPSRLRRRLDASGLADLAVGRLIIASIGSLLAVTVLMLLLTGSLVVGLACGTIGASAPFLMVSNRSDRRRQALAAAWPDAVDDLASAVRAGLSLPDALVALSDRGPIELRGPFSRFGADYRVTGSFVTCLDRLKADLADPVGDRVIEALRLARDVGGGELGRLLRTLSSVLREDARARGELIARQSWAVNAARLAVCAPWATLILMSLRPGGLTSYNSLAGLLVLAIAGGMSMAAYVLMRRIGKLPIDERVLS
ncbi:MAG: type II secretion system F family protein [Actinomycetes bacterium]